jgi:hypothetical protein
VGYGPDMNIELFIIYLFIYFCYFFVGAFGWFFWKWEHESMGRGGTVGALNMYSLYSNSYNLRS